jgi:hypothetical protein
MIAPLTSRTAVRLRDMMPDGKRSVVVRPDDDGAERRMMFLLNFGDELRRRLAESH